MLLRLKKWKWEVLGKDRLILYFITRTQLIPIEFYLIYYADEIYFF